MTWTPATLKGLAARPQIRPTLGGYQLCYPGSRHVFSGPQESCKTLVAYFVALGVRREGGTVLVIDFEMGPHEARGRMLELGATDDDLDALYYVEPEEKMSDPSMDAMIDLDPSLVVIDAAAGAYALEGLDDNKRSDVEQFQQTYIRPFWMADVATITIDHVTKAAETRGAYAIGSERKVGGTDVHLGFETVTSLNRGGRGLYRIKTHKDRPGWLPRPTLGELQVWSDPDTHALKVVVQPPSSAEEIAETGFRPTGLMERVSRFLELRAAPVSQNTVESDVLGRAEYKRMAITRLVDEGYVDRTDGPNRTHLLSSVTAFREADDSGASPPSASNVNPHLQAVNGASLGASVAVDAPVRPGPLTAPPKGGAEEPPNVVSADTASDPLVDEVFEREFHEWRAS